MGKLLRRNGRYSTRRRVPTDLIATYGGKKEIVIALGTADPAEARSLHAIMWVKLDEEFDARRRELAQAGGGAADRARITAALRDAPQEVRISALVERLRQMREKAAEQGGLEDWTHMARLDLAMHQAALDGHGDDLSLTMDKHEVGRNALRAVLEGDTAAAFASATAHHDLAKAIPISDLIDRWAIAQQPTEKTLRKAKSIIAEVEAVHGTRRCPHSW